MKPGRVRPLALCVFRKNDLILVQEGYDAVKNQTFYPSTRRWHRVW